MPVFRLPACIEKLHPFTVPAKVGAKSPYLKFKHLPAGTRIDHPISENELLITGAKSGNVFVIDIDIKDGKDGQALLRGWLDRNGRELPRTLVVKTPSGGFHLYFRYPPERTVKSDNGSIAFGGRRNETGIDIKGDPHGLVVAPWSMKPDGKLYEVIYEVEDIPLAPEWLLDAVAPVRATRGSAQTHGPIPVVDVPMPVIPIAGADRMDLVAHEALQANVKRLLANGQGSRNVTMFAVGHNLGHLARSGCMIDFQYCYETIGAVLFQSPHWRDVIAKELDTFRRAYEAVARTDFLIIHEQSWDIEYKTKLMVDALGARPNVFVIGNKLHRMVGDPLDATVEFIPLSLAGLKSMLSEFIEFHRPTKESTKRVQPPPWAAESILAQGAWPGVRVIKSVAHSPILRPDGSIHLGGYCDVTGVFVLGRHAQRPLMDPNEARGRLLELVKEFPFESSKHLAAWFASLFTPIAAHAFDGPIPIFVFEASLPGAGKSKLAAATAKISTGRLAGVSQLAKNDESETRKLITSWIYSPKPVVLLDNARTLGSAALCALVSAPDRAWEDRELGRNQMVRGVFNATIYVTGNNLSYGEDMHRRVCPIMLTPNTSRPEERTFEVANFGGYVQEHLDELSWAAISLVAWAKQLGAVYTGREWGSFEGWCSTVLAAVEWCGLGTLDGVRQSAEDSSSGREENRAILEALFSIEEMRDSARGLRTKDLITLARGFSTRNDVAAWRETYLDLEEPNANLIGYKFRKLRNHVIDINGVEVRFSSRLSQGIMFWVFFGVGMPT